MLSRSVVGFIGNTLVIASSTNGALTCMLFFQSVLHLFKY
jgi:hypothetical protein